MDDRANPRASGKVLPVECNRPTGRVSDMPICNSFLTPSPAPHPVHVLRIADNRAAVVVAKGVGHVGLLVPAGRASARS